MKIQIDLPKETNKRLKLYKIRNSFITMQDAVISILNDKLKNEK